MSGAIGRRSFLATGVTAGAGVVLGGCAPAIGAATDEPRYQGGASPWPVCLCTSTIRPTPLVEKITIAAEVGYDAIEPWVDELQGYEAEGGNLQELGQRIRDLGLFVPNVIGLWNAIPATESAWQESLVGTRERMRMASAIGSQFVQVVPQPARPWTEFDPKWGADRYRDLLRIGREEFGVIPAMVFVAFLEGVARTGQAAQLAIDADDADACIIPDTYHMYRGRSGFKGIRHLQGDFIAIFQICDVPSDPPLEQLEDRHRVYPGDGILPLREVLQDLRHIGFRRAVSVELYHPVLWEQDPRLVARTGLEKTRELIREALA
jgi:2-keto-myo-inositol isomerase